MISCVAPAPFPDRTSAGWIAPASPGAREQTLKHGRYTAEAIVVQRREMAALIRACQDRLDIMRDL
jgi:hypothetical protein